MGEQVAVLSHVVLSKRARSRVRVRVVGRESIGWADTANMGGVLLEAVVVTDVLADQEIVKQLTTTAPTTVS